MDLNYQGLKRTKKNSIILEKQENIEVKQNSTEYFSKKSTVIREKLCGGPIKSSISYEYLKEKEQVKEKFCDSTCKLNDEIKLLQEAKRLLLSENKKMYRKIHQNKSKNETWAQHLADNKSRERKQPQQLYRHDKQVNTCNTSSQTAVKREFLIDGGAVGDCNSNFKLKTKITNKSVQKQALTKPNNQTVNCYYGILEQPACPCAKICHHHQHQQTAANDKCEYTYCRDEYYYDYPNCAHKAKNHHRRLSSDLHTNYFYCCSPDRAHYNDSTRIDKNSKGTKSKSKEKYERTKRTNVKHKQRHKSEESNEQPIENFYTELSNKDALKILKMLVDDVTELRPQRHKTTKISNAASISTKAKIKTRKKQHEIFNTKNHVMIENSEVSVDTEYSIETLHMLKQMTIREYVPTKPNKKQSYEIPQKSDTLYNNKQPEKIKNYKKYMDAYAQEANAAEKTIQVWKEPTNNFPDQKSEELDFFVKQDSSQRKENQTIIADKTNYSFEQVSPHLSFERSSTKTDTKFSNIEDDMSTILIEETQSYGNYGYDGDEHTKAQTDSNQAVRDLKLEHDSHFQLNPIVEGDYKTELQKDFKKKPNNQIDDSHDDIQQQKQELKNKLDKQQIKRSSYQYDTTENKIKTSLDNEFNMLRDEKAQELTNHEDIKATNNQKVQKDIENKLKSIKETEIENKNKAEPYRLPQSWTSSKEELTIRESKDILADNDLKDIKLKSKLEDYKTKHNKEHLFEMTHGIEARAANEKLKENFLHDLDLGKTMETNNPSETSSFYNEYQQQIMDAKLEFYTHKSSQTENTYNAEPEKTLAEENANKSPRPLEAFKYLKNIKLQLQTDIEEKCLNSVLRAANDLITSLSSCKSLLNQELLTSQDDFKEPVTTSQDKSTYTLQEKTTQGTQYKESESITDTSEIFLEQQLTETHSFLNLIHNNKDELQVQPLSSNENTTRKLESPDVMKTLKELENLDSDEAELVLSENNNNESKLESLLLMKQAAQENDTRELQKINKFASQQTLPLSESNHQADVKTPAVKKHLAQADLNKEMTKKSEYFKIPQLSLPLSESLDSDLESLVDENINAALTINECLAHESYQFHTQMNAQHWQTLETFEQNRECQENSSFSPKHTEFPQEQESSLSYCVLDNEQTFKEMHRHYINRVFPTSSRQSAIYDSDLQPLKSILKSCSLRENTPDAFCDMETFRTNSVVSCAQTEQKSCSTISNWRQETMDTITFKEPIYQDCQLETESVQEYNFVQHSPRTLGTTEMPVFKQCPCMWVTYLKIMAKYYEEENK